MTNKQSHLNRLLFLALVLVISVAAGGCNKDDDDNQPDVKYQVIYSVSSVGELNMEEIVYRDADGVEQVVTNQRDLNITIEANSGFSTLLRAKGSIVNGAVLIRISAWSPNGQFDIEDSDGHTAGGAAKAFDLSLSRALE